VGSKAGTLTVNSSASNPSLAVALSGTGVNPTTDLAAGHPTFESSHVQTYSSAAVTDSDPASYWESANNAFPQWVEIDLGSVQTISRVTLRLPPLASWATRTQTLSLLGSVDRVSYSTVLGSTSCTFNPSTGNTVTLSFAPVSVRYLRVQITGNTGWPAGQLSQVEVYNS
jgi:hypothetical protein